MLCLGIRPFAQGGSRRRIYLGGAKVISLLGKSKDNFSAHSSFDQSSASLDQNRQRLGGRGWKELSS